MYRFVIFKKTYQDLKKKNLFLPDKFNGLRVLIATYMFSEDTVRIRTAFKKQGDRVKVATYKEDTSGEHGVYSVKSKGGVLGKAFDYFYHMYKIAAWADVVYLIADSKIIVPSVVACKLKNLSYVLEVDKNFFFGSLEAFIAKQARLIVVRDESLISVIEKIGIDPDNVVYLPKEENIKIAEYLL